MSRFARERTVVYVEPPIYLKSLRRRLRAGSLPLEDLYRARTSRETDGLYLFQTGALCPVSLRGSLEKLTWSNWQNSFDRCIRELEITNFIAWVSKPSWLPILERISSDRLIYHVVDEYSAYSGLSEPRRKQIVALEKEMLGRADLVIVVSKKLLESKRRDNPNTYLVPNGVDIDAYASKNSGNRAPVDLRDLTKPIIGYSGLIARRLDLELLTKLAVRRPNYSLVLLGAVNERGCEPEIRRLRSLKNVYFLGLKPSDQVPAYVAGFDICMIPYAINERSANADPLKLYEYSAAGKVTVCTEFDAARAAGPFCRIADTPEQFIRLIDEELTVPSKNQVFEQAQLWAAANSWEKRLEQISELVKD